MNLNELANKLKANRQQLQAFGVASLNVFGSVARGQERPGSDVDLMVDFVQPSTFDRYMGLKLFLEDLLGTRVDLVTRPAVRPEIRPFVEQDIRRVA